MRMILGWVLLKTTQPSRDATAKDAHAANQIKDVDTGCQTNPWTYRTLKKITTYKENVRKI